MNAPLRRRPGVAEPPAVVAEPWWRVHRAGIGAAIVLVAGTAAIWGLAVRSADRLRRQPDAILLPEAIEVEGIEPWVRADLRAEALRDASLDVGLPLDDPALQQRLARAFDMHPWVRDVEGVEIRHPAAAIVRIRCREPVAMVAVPGGLLAVDADGVVLPSADFTAESAAAYPRLAGIASTPVGGEGTAWGDPTVSEGALVAAAIGPDWTILGGDACRPEPEQDRRRWVLVKEGAGTIVFGSAPGQEAGGEPTAAAKVARLRMLAFPAAGESIDLRIDALPAEEPSGPRSIPVDDLSPSPAAAPPESGDGPPSDTTRTAPPRSS